MGSTSFYELRTYRLAARLGDQLHELVGSWSSFNRWSIGIQLVRTADSIGANIAEGLGRWHRADQVRFLFIARGSLYETEHWIQRATARGLLEPNKFDADLLELRRTITGLIAKRRNLTSDPLTL